MSERQERGLGAHADTGFAVDDRLPAWLREIIQEEGRLTLTDYETARLLGISRGSVRQAIGAGEVHSVRLGRRLLVPVIPLLRLLGQEDALQGAIDAE